MLSFDEACSIVDEPIWYEAWRADFDASAASLEAGDLQLLSGDALQARCRALGFPSEATETLLRERSSWDEPRVRRLGAHVQWLQAERYTPGGYLALGWPPPPRNCPLLYAYAGLGVSARTQAEHRRVGIAPDVTAATLWDVGQQVLLHQRIHGESGMAKGFWITHHLASHLFRLGRLQHQRAWFKHDLGPLAPGDPVLDVHIPEDGPLAPDACDASFDAARTFFARHFPGDGARWFTCSSWLLDPQLAEILPEDSNIVRFQRRFEQIETGERSSGSVFEFVFDRPDLDREEAPDLSGLSRRSLLERALLDHYSAGGRIHATFGAIPIQRAASVAPKLAR